MQNTCEKHEKFVMESNCPSMTHEEATVTVPVSVRAFANVGNVEFKCMGQAVVTRNSDFTPGRPCAVSKFTISQKLRVDIPIKFKAEAETGEGYVDFASLTENDPEKYK